MRKFGFGVLAEKAGQASFGQALLDAAEEAHTSQGHLFPSTGSVSIASRRRTTCAATVMHGLNSRRSPLGCCHCLIFGCATWMPFSQSQ
jgi:hypothetical protein